MGDHIQEMQGKLSLLKEIIGGMESAAVAYSGGVDSTFLLKVAFEVLRDKAIGIYVDSPLQPVREKEDALRNASLTAAEIVVLNADPLVLQDFRSNPVNRCYFCKGFLFDKIIQFAVHRGFHTVLDGSNFDDLKDFRPGKQALTERSVRSPLQEAGLIKSEIRALSKTYGLPTWNKEAYACLASRIPYQTEITYNRLSQVNRVEEILLDNHYCNVRARYYGDSVRLETRKDQIAMLRKDLERPEFAGMIKREGFSVIEIDPLGYRQGSLNENPGDK